MVDINLVPREYKEEKQKFAGIFSKAGKIAIALLILSLLIYGGLLFYNSKLQARLDNINDEISNIEQKRDLDKENKMIDLDKKLSVLKEMFDNGKSNAPLL